MGTSFVKGIFGALTFLLLLGLSGCSDDPLELLISTDPDTWQQNKEMYEAIENLNAEDRKCINSALDKIRKEWSIYAAQKKLLDIRLSSGDDISRSHYSSPAMAPKKPSVEYKKIGELVRSGGLQCIKW